MSIPEMTMAPDPGPARSESPPASARLRLYIARSTPNSIRAEQNLAAVLAVLGAAAASMAVEVIDVFVSGKRAILDGVIVTPTLVILRGDARHVIVGDLSDVSQLRALLEDVPPEAPRRAAG
jgi:hypothetical protein